MHEYILQGRDIWSVSLAGHSPFWNKLLRICDEVLTLIQITDIPALLGDSARKWITKVYSLLNPSSPLVDWLDMLWPRYNIAKTEVICWLEILNRLAFKDRLMRFVPSIGLLCALCGEAQESRDRLFFSSLKLSLE